MFDKKMIRTRERRPKKFAGGNWTCRTPRQRRGRIGTPRHSKGRPRRTGPPPQETTVEGNVDPRTYSSLSPLAGRILRRPACGSSDNPPRARLEGGSSFMVTTERHERVKSAECAHPHLFTGFCGSVANGRKEVGPRPGVLPLSVGSLAF